MDGLIIESESLQSKAYEQIIKEYGKIPILRENGLVQQVGIRGDQDRIEILKRHNMTGDIEQIKLRKREIYLEILKENLYMLPGVKKLLILLKGIKVKTALVSGTNREIVEYILNGLEIYDFFTVIVAGDEVKNGKPHPEGFLKAAKKLNTDPKNCLVLEDASPGVVAAKLAGMKVIAVPNEYTINNDFSKADKVIRSLTEINLKILNF